MSQSCRIPLVCLCVLTSLVLAPVRVQAMGGSTLGYTTVGSETFPEWIRFQHVVNHHSQIGNSWVNQFNSYFFYADTAGLNEILRRYAAVEMDEHKVTVSPLPFGVDALPILKTGQYNVAVSWGTGLSANLNSYVQVKALEKTIPPSIRIYLSSKNPVDQLVIPPNVELVYQHHFESKYLKSILDPKTDGDRVAQITHLMNADRCQSAVAEAICGCIRDENAEVQRAAITQLRNYLGPSENIIHELQVLKADVSGEMQDQVQRTIDELVVREVPLERVEAYNRKVDEIQMLCQLQKLRAAEE